MRFAQDESDDEENAHKKKPIPSWAQKAQLEQAQLRQLHVDPDAIFGVCRKTCNLADVFEGGKKKKCFVERKSTGNWIRDQLSLQEEESYKRQMGQLKSAADL